MGAERRASCTPGLSCLVMSMFDFRTAQKIEKAKIKLVSCLFPARICFRAIRV